MSEPHTIPPHEPLSSENDPTGRWRIAELEAEALEQTEVAREALKRAEQAEAALEEAITYTIKYGPYQGSSRETVWADLRARAEEAKP